MNEVALSPREKVQALEDEIAKLPQVDCPVRHYFAPGLYAREMTIPAGCALTGAVHRTEHLCTVSKGHIWVDDGTGLVELFGGATFVSKPGVKRAGAAVKTTVFTTYHATNTTDLDALADELFESSAEELMGGAKNKQALNQPLALEYAGLADVRSDYAAFLAEYGLTEEFVRRLVENESDLIAVPLPRMYLARSPIHGNGMFAAGKAAMHDWLGPARIGDCRTMAGRFINHSPSPNVMFMRANGGGLDVIALKDIAASEEITVDYRQACRTNGAGLRPVKEITT